MKRASFLSMAAAAGMVAGIATAGEAAGRHLFTSLDVFGLEFPADPQVSPDGKRLAYVRRSNDILTDGVRSTIWSIDLATGEHEPLVTGPGSYGAPRWSPRGDRLLYVANEEQDSAELRVLSLRDRVSLSLLKSHEKPRQATWSPDGAAIVYTLFVPGQPISAARPPERPEGAHWAPVAQVFERLQLHRNGTGLVRPGETHLFVVSAAGGPPRDLTPGDVSFVNPAWLDAKTVLANAYEGKDIELRPYELDIYAIDVRTTARSALTRRDGPDEGPLPSPDGKQLAFIGYDDKRIVWQAYHLYVMNTDGSGVRNLTGSYDRSVRAPQWDPDGKSLYVLAENQGETHLLHVDLTGRIRTVARDVGAGSAGRPYSGGEFSVGGPSGHPAIVYTQDAWDHPADLALLQSHGTRRLTSLNAELLSHVDLATVESFKVKSSADGRILDAWLAKPPGFKPDGSYPLILEIHGGPQAMYGASFSSELQRYAAEGFVVAWANPRGSTGYGAEFTNLIDRNFPGEDYDDLMSVVDSVLARAYASPRRLFVTGSSGGGSLTAWTVGKTNRFAAAAAISPVINWTTIMLFAQTAAQVAEYRLRTFPWDDLSLFWRSSPLSLAGHVKTPTLLMVGEEDWDTPPVEATQFYTALKLRGIETRLITVPGAAHNISARPSQHAIKTDNVIEWFKAHDFH